MRFLPGIDCFLYLAFRNNNFFLKNQLSFIDFVLKEWLVITAGITLILTTLYTKHIPVYSEKELQVVFMLFVLFVAVTGLQKSGLIIRIAQSIEKGRFVPLKLVIVTFFLSMLITIDVTLIVIVPVTLSLNINKKELIVILESLAANTGSSLMPFGNPQNLFIYWFYDLRSEVFIATIAPFALSFLGLLIIASLFIKTNHIIQKKAIQKINQKAYYYGVFLFTIILTILHILPAIMAVFVVIFAIIFDRKALRVDYTLLITFLLFFGIADNLQMLLIPEINHSGHVFLFSALASQIISNVPATLLFAEYTQNWQALLWGASAGGLGGLFGSMARLIVYKIYVRHESTNNTTKFTILFLITGYLAMFLSIGLYFILY